MDPLTAAIIGVLTGLAGLIAAVTVWVKTKTANEQIRAERAATCKSRDEDSQNMHDDILQLKFEATRARDDIKLLFSHSEDLNKQIGVMNTQLAEVLTQMGHILDTLKELKERK